MNRSSHALFASVILFTAVGLFVGCEKETTPAANNSADVDHPTGTMGSTTQPSMEKVAVADMKPSKAATTQPANNNVMGTVTFTQMADGKVKVSAHITGLEPNSSHGFHIHQTGDLSAADLSSAGGHYNPENHQHAGPSTEMRHAGDLGNITADATGMAMYDITVDNISLGGAKNDVVGKPVIIHGKADDLKTQPTGDAGSRVAGGIIQMKM